MKFFFNGFLRNRRAIAGRVILMKASADTHEKHPVRDISNDKVDIPLRGPVV
jgi:hypothetical protein